jgi:hypothetical protein
MNKDRLLQLAQHLETGQLGHKVFDFGIYNSANEPYCGTSGCAIGECPILWPHHWCFGPCGSPILRTSTWGYDSAQDAQEWFDIGFDQRAHLFVPEQQMTNLFGGKYLKETATKEEVAANIRAFVAKMEEEGQ